MRNLLLSWLLISAVFSSDEAISRYTIGSGIHWDLTKDKPGLVEGGKVVWYINTSEKCLQYAKDAFDAWSSIPGTNIKFKYAGITDEDWQTGTHNVIMFGGYPFPQNTTGYSIMRNGAVCVVINIGMMLNIEGMLRATIMHEIGHMIGLGHSTDKLAIMYYAHGIGAVPKFTVDDAAGVVSLYKDSIYSGYLPGDCNYILYSNVSIQILVKQNVPYSPCSAGFSYSIGNEIFNNFKYLWDFGDGSTSSDSLPTHIYTTPGTYDVQFIATDLYTKYIGMTKVVIEADINTKFGVSGTIIIGNKNKSSLLITNLPEVGGITLVAGNKRYSVCQKNKKFYEIVGLDQNIDLTNGFVIRVLTNHAYNCTIPASSISLRTTKINKTYKISY